MAKAGSAQKKPVIKGVEWDWHEAVAGERWTISRIPEGEAAGPRVQRTFSRSGVTKEYKYIAYRNFEVLGIRGTPQEAMRLAESGKKEWGTKDNVQYYADHYPGDVPPFLLLTAEERKQVRSTYSYAAPAQAKVDSAERRAGGKVDARDLTDPSTVRYLEQLEKKIASGPVSAGAEARGPRQRADAPPKEKRSRKEAMSLEEVQSRTKATMHKVRAFPGRKPGSAVEKRWNLMLEHCEQASSVATFLKKGGNPETLRNGINKGFVELKNG